MNVKSISNYLKKPLPRWRFALLSLAALALFLAVALALGLSVGLKPALIFFGPIFVFIIIYAYSLLSRRISDAGFLGAPLGLLGLIVIGILFGFGKIGFGIILLFLLFCFCCAIPTNKTMRSTETNDSGMYKMVAYVVIAPTALILLVMFVARILGSDHVDPTDTLGTVAMVQAEDEAAETIVASAEFKSPANLYASACAACHTSGVAGAPMLGDAAVWANRTSVGLATLVTNAINGKGVMPARGGSTLSDDEIELAVKYLTGL